MGRKYSDLPEIEEIVLDRTQSHNHITGVPLEIEERRLKMSRGVIGRLTYEGEQILIPIAQIDGVYHPNRIENLEYTVTSLTPVGKGEITSATRFRVIAQKE